MVTSRNKRALENDNIISRSRSHIREVTPIMRNESDRSSPAQCRGNITESPTETQASTGRYVRKGSYCVNFLYQHKGNITNDISLTTDEKKEKRAILIYKQRNLCRKD